MALREVEGRLLEAEGDLKAQHKDVVQDEQGLF